MFSIWEKESFLAPQDVIIVGSGFAGLWSALYLKKNNPKSKITIVDRGIFPTGASSRNAGFACFGSLSELMYDSKTMGADKMLEVVEMRFKGLERIQKYFSADDIDFELCGGYELFDNSGKYTKEELENSIGYLNSILKPVIDTKKTFALADNKIAEFGFSNTTHLVKNSLEGYLHSGKLIQCLLQKVQGMGVQVFNGIEIKGFEKSAHHFELRTNQAFNFTASKILVCTNAFAKELLPQTNITPARGQVLVTSPIKDLPWKGTFHSEEGFYYFRNLGKRVLLGGARNKAFQAEETTDTTTSEFIQKELERYLNEVILPANKEPYRIEHRWSGIMGMGVEKRPEVKELEPGVFCAIAMGGMGVAVAPIVGQKAAQLIL
jgi:glycine/D-amino acid oxidase-like deaminating enzyme